MSETEKRNQSELQNLLDAEKTSQNVEMEAEQEIQPEFQYELQTRDGRYRTLSQTISKILLTFTAGAGSAGFIAGILEAAEVINIESSDWYFYPYVAAFLALWWFIFTYIGPFKKKKNNKL